MASPRAGTKTKRETTPDQIVWTHRCQPLLDGGQGKNTLISLPCILQTKQTGMEATETPWQETTRWMDTLATAQPVPNHNHPEVKAAYGSHLTPSTAAHGPAFPGLAPPSICKQEHVTGEATPRLRIENKQKQRTLQLKQTPPTWWTTHRGTVRRPTTTSPTHSPGSF